MGSMIKTESFPSYKLKAIFDALKDLPYKVLWKAVPENFPKDLEIPSNIHFESWMPQLDVLCKYVITNLFMSSRSKLFESTKITTKYNKGTFNTIICYM